MIPPFDQDVGPGGYAWWYLDAISDDGRYGLTLIAFIGSVFSPYYAWARSRGRSDPLSHCAINVALYGPGGRWSMTERGRSSVERDHDSLNIGPSGLQWNGDTLDIELSEWAAPIPRRILGTISVHPIVASGEPLARAVDPCAEYSLLIVDHQEGTIGQPRHARCLLHPEGPTLPHPRAPRLQLRHGSA